jgi:hypothetical protein
MTEARTAEPVKPRFALFLFVVAGFCVGSLAAGAGFIDWTLPGGLPFGNLLASIGLCALAGTALALCPHGSLRRRVAWIVLFVAALWLPFSIALAGNLALDFSGTRGSPWWLATATLVLAILLCLAWSVAAFLPGLRRRSRT